MSSKLKITLISISRAGLCLRPKATENSYLTIIMITIMMGKMEMVLPDMYMMNRFIGTYIKKCF